MKPRILVYDIEVPHLKARIWRLGDQVVRYNNLLKSVFYTKILTISYKWLGEKGVKILTCGKDGSNIKHMLNLFDEEIRKADIVIGKNNDRFDNKHLNTQRLLETGKPMPEWLYKSDDLEKQLRKYFNFPSHSLDFVSQLVTGSGKMKMEEDDWNNIEDMIEVNKLEKILKKKLNDKYCQYMYGKNRNIILKVGNKAFLRMQTYNKIDVIRTAKLIKKVLPHVIWRHNSATACRQFSPFCCITCGSNAVSGKKVVTRGTTLRHEFYCNAHKGYAGSRPFMRRGNSCKKYTGPMGK